MAVRGFASSSLSSPSRNFAWLTPRPSTKRPGWRTRSADWPAAASSALSTQMLTIPVATVVVRVASSSSSATSKIGWPVPVPPGSQRVP